MTNRQLAAQETRRKLIEAGRVLFREKGTSNVSIDDITATCGVAKGTFYTYFKNKAEIISEIGISGFARLRDETLASDAPFLDRLGNYMVRFARSIEEMGLKLCQNWVRSNVDPDEKGASSPNKLDADLSDMKTVLEDGIKRGELASDAPVDTLCHAFVAVLYGEMLCWDMSGGRTGFEERTEEFCNTFLNAMIAPWMHGERDAK